MTAPKEDSVLVIPTAATQYENAIKNYLIEELGLSAEGTKSIIDAANRYNLPANSIDTETKWNIFAAAKIKTKGLFAKPNSTPPGMIEVNTFSKEGVLRALSVLLFAQSQPKETFIGIELLIAFITKAPALYKIKNSSSTLLNDYLAALIFEDLIKQGRNGNPSKPVNLVYAGKEYNEHELSAVMNKKSKPIDFLVALYEQNKSQFEEAAAPATSLSS